MAKLKEYVEAVCRKELPNPGTSSFDTIEAANKDPLILAKLQTRYKLGGIDLNLNFSFSWRYPERFVHS